MVATKQEVLTIVHDFVTKLETQGIRVQQVVLFGSYSRGLPHRWSDVDLVVISPDFKRLKPLERIRLLAEVTYQCDHRLEPLAYTPGEYQRSGPASFLGEVKRTGRVVYKAA